MTCSDGAVHNASGKPTHYSGFAASVVGLTKELGNEQERRMARMPKCDCLNWCGDDSRVPNGKAKPCQRWLREQAEAEERWSMEEDAARYRWLRKNSGYTIRCDLFGEVGTHEHTDDDLDALIDAQMVPNSNSTT